MKSLDVISVLGPLSGMSGVVVGPFMVFDLTNEEAVFKSLELGQHGMEAVPTGSKTQAHAHEFVSVYKALGLDLISGNVRYPLPEKALVIVFPEVTHSWLPKNDSASVGSCDQRHEEQVLVSSEG